jgi:serine/threonine protein phosphatase PrpC
MTRPAYSFLGAYETPPSATAQVTFGAASRRGRQREINDDHYLVMRLGRYQESLLTSLPDNVLTKRFEEYGYAMIVADGLGTDGAGESASRLALVTLDHLITYFGRWNLRVDDDIAQEIMARAERFYRHVDGAVMAQHRAGAIATDQTTLTAIFGAGHDLFFAHVGHSRAYLYRGDKLLRLTRDHTIAQQQSAAARAPLIDVNAGARDLAHVLTDTIGMSGRVGPTVDIERLTVDDGDRVLLCTNGLTDAVDEEGLGRILGSSATPDDMCRALVELAGSHGADDDATAVVAHYHFPA